MPEEKYEESKPKTFKLGEVGDFIQGVFLKRDKTTNADKYGKYSFIYTVKALKGSFHDSTKNEKTGKFTVNAEPTVINEGEEYSIFVTIGSIMAGKLNDGKLGQRFRLEFTEIKDTGKGNPAKITKVAWAKDADGQPFIDPQWREENPIELKDM